METAPTIVLPLTQAQVAVACKSAPAVFLSLLSMRRPDGSIWSNRDELAARTGLTGGTVTAGINALIESNWIRRNPDSWSHGYIINPHVLTRLGLDDGRTSHAA